MVKMIFFCDKCGAEIVKDDPISFHAEALDKESGGELAKVNSYYPDLDGKHFCGDCADVIHSLFVRHCNNESATSQPKDVKEAPTTRPGSKKRKLDGGKIRALKNAGWTVKAIAEEMNCSETAIYNAFKKLGISVDKKKAPEQKSTEQSETII